MKNKTHVEFLTVNEALDGADAVLFIGRQDRLLADDVLTLLPDDSETIWSAMIDAAKPGDKGGAHTTWRATAPTRLMAGVLPDAGSRHSAPGRPDAIGAIVAKAPKVPRLAIIIAADQGAHAFAAGLAVARALPDYSHKSTAAEPREVFVAVLPAEGEAPDTKRLQVAADAVRQAAALVDAPTNALHTDTFVELARATATAVGAQVTVLQGEQIPQAGLGGLWGVGKAATHGPALVILEHRGTGGETIALVGKGIVYDTGGLSIKGKAHMPGMKTDMGGAAGVLGAFLAAAELNSPHRIFALLCLAENSVGPDSVRPDDVLTMYSGKTVEVNNTDAEGRLVLADGVAWATRHLSPSIVIDLATLTGGQLVATGRRHAAAISNDADLEQRSIDAGRRSGELVHGLPYCPEFFRSEFHSDVADMKNSVKDRMNAQASCAAQFIAEHLDSDWHGRWLHLDIAGPAVHNDRGTGYGVGLLLELFADLESPAST